MRYDIVACQGNDRRHPCPVWPRLLRTKVASAKAEAGIALLAILLSLGCGSSPLTSSSLDASADQPVRPDPIPGADAALPPRNPDTARAADGLGLDGAGGHPVPADASSPPVCPAPPLAAVSTPPSLLYLAGVTVTTLAGSESAGNQDGTGPEAAFGNPVSVAIDPTSSTSDPDLVVCDFDNDQLRRVTGAGVVTTLLRPDDFARPFGMVFSPGGDLFVDTDFNPDGVKNQDSGSIWRVDPSSGVTTLVKANVGRPRGLAWLPDGRLVLSDGPNLRVRLLDPNTGVVSELAGSATDCPGSRDGTGAEARFSHPYGAVVTAQGKILIADYGSHTLRLITTDGEVSTFAGTPGVAGATDGARAQALFYSPQGLAIDAAGFVYVSDHDNHLIRRITPAGQVETVAGDGTSGFRDGIGMQAQFFGQEGLAVSADGKTLYVADGSNGDGSPFNRIRVVTLAP